MGTFIHKHKKVARCCFWRLGDRDLGSGLTGLDFSDRGELGIQNLIGFRALGGGGFGAR